jgi:hypothetical protein
MFGASLPVCSLPYKGGLGWEVQGIFWANNWGLWRGPCAESGGNELCLELVDIYLYLIISLLSYLAHSYILRDATYSRGQYKAMHASVIFPVLSLVIWYLVSHHICCCCVYSYSFSKREQESQYKAWSFHDKLSSICKHAWHRHHLTIWQVGWW